MIGSVLYHSEDVKYNSKIKAYPDGTVNFTCCNKPIFVKKGFELASYKKVEETEKKNYNTDNTRSDSIRRAKCAVFDIAKMNKFKYFVTLTLDAEKIDRYAIIPIKKKLIKWLNNMEQRHDLHYLLLPEYHKDGAIHMHMLCSGNLRLIETDKKDKAGRTIYNVDNWKLGFSTAIIMDGDNENVSKYVTKYVTKDSRKIFGKFYYSGGKNLVREVPTTYFNSDYNKLVEIFNINEFEVFNNLKFCYPTYEEIGECIVNE